MMKVIVVLACLAAVALAGVDPTLAVDYNLGEAGEFDRLSEDFIAGVQFGANDFDCGGMAGRYSVQIIGRNDGLNTDRGNGGKIIGIPGGPPNNGPSTSPANSYSGNRGGNRNGGGRGGSRSRRGGPSDDIPIDIINPRPGGRRQQPPGCPSFHGQMEIAFPGDKNAPRNCGIPIVSLNNNNYGANEVNTVCCVRMVGIACETNADPGCHFTTTRDNIQISYGTYEGWDIPFLSTIYSIDDNIFGDFEEDYFEGMLSVTPSGDGKGLYLLGGQDVFESMYVADDRGSFDGDQGCVFNGEARFVAENAPGEDPYREFDDAEGYEGYYYYGGSRSKAKSPRSVEKKKNVTPKVKSLFDIDLKEWREGKTAERAQQQEAIRQRRQLRNLQSGAQQ